MGSGASSLTKEQSAKLTSILKEKYEAMKASGQPEADIQAKLTAEYHEIIVNLKLNTIPTKTTEEPAKLSKIGKSATSSSTSKLATRASFEKENSQPRLGSKLGSSKMTSGSIKGGGSRRRSFDQKQSPAAATAAAVAAAAATQASRSTEENKPTEQTETTPTITPGSNSPLPSTAEEIQADSWDSVSQQPFCAVCQMAFKSLTFLDRHVKYSDLHVKNVNKQKEASEPTPIGTADEMFPVSQSGKMEAKQIEGKHYRLLYSGAKLFWRTQESIDLNIYHHILPSTIEIVSFDPVKSKEMNRIYCDYTALCDLSGVTAAAMASAGARAAASRAAAAREMQATSSKGTVINAKHAAATAEAEAAAVAAADPSNVEEETAMLARYIIQRLQLGPPTAPGSNMKTMEFVQLSSDTNIKSPVMDKVPVVLIPIAVARRRRTNAEEIEATMSSLVTDRAALAEATSHAHKVASVMYSASTSIAAKKWWADFNPVRKRWIWAIRRVIRQKLVAETTAVLNALEVAKKRELKRAYTGGLSGKAKEI